MIPVNNYQTGFEPPTSQIMYACMVDKQNLRLNLVLSTGFEPATLIIHLSGKLRNYELICVVNLISNLTHAYEIVI